MHDCPSPHFGEQLPLLLFPPEEELELPPSCWDDDELDELHAMTTRVRMALEKERVFTGASVAHPELGLSPLATLSVVRRAPRASRGAPARGS
jgi:hypothetical protein